MIHNSRARRLAEADVAALHMARVRSGRADARTVLRWRGKIRLWAYRFPDELPRRGTGEQRRAVYDLAELEALADRLGVPRV